MFRYVVFLLSLLMASCTFCTFEVPEGRPMNSVEYCIANQLHELWLEHKYLDWNDQDCRWPKVRILQQTDPDAEFDWNTCYEETITWDGITAHLFAHELIHWGRHCTVYNSDHDHKTDVWKLEKMIDNSCIED